MLHILAAFAILTGSPSVAQDRADFLGKWICSTNRSYRVYVIKEQDTYLFKTLYKGEISSSEPAEFSQGVFTITRLFETRYHLEDGGKMLVTAGTRYRRLSDQEARELNAMHDQERALKAEAERQARLDKADADRKAKRAREVEAARWRIRDACRLLDKDTVLVEAKKYPEAFANPPNTDWLYHTLDGIKAPIQAREDFLRFLIDLGCTVAPASARNLGVRIGQLFAINYTVRGDFFMDEDKVTDDAVWWLQFVLSEGANLDFLGGNQPLTSTRDVFEVLAINHPDDKNVLKLRDIVRRAGGKRASELRDFSKTVGDLGLVPVYTSHVYRSSEYQGYVTILMIRNGAIGGETPAIPSSAAALKEHKVRGIKRVIVNSGSFESSFKNWRDEYDDLYWDSKGELWKKYGEDNREWVVVILDRNGVNKYSFYPRGYLNDTLDRSNEKLTEGLVAAGIWTK
jgi:hypothetical protein